MKKKLLFVLLGLLFNGNLFAENKFNLPIVLIGPLSVGKSTVAKELERKISIRNVPLDAVSQYYYFKHGYSDNHFERLNDELEKEKYMKTFDIKVIKDVLADFPKDIIDFGAGHSHYEDQASIKKAKQILSPFKNVILLLPSKDNRKSMEILKRNMKKLLGEEPSKYAIDVGEKYLKSASNKELAKKIVYTENRPPKEIAEEIVKILD